MTYKQAKIRAKYYWWFGFINYIKHQLRFLKKV
jgi:hypothetical protein